MRHPGALVHDVQVLGWKCFFSARCGAVRAEVRIRMENVSALILYGGLKFAISVQMKDRECVAPWVSSRLEQVINGCICLFIRAHGLRGKNKGCSSP